MEAGERYLRGLLFVVRWGSGRYMLVHPASGTATPTDFLGAWVVGRLIRGYSVGDVGAMVERRAAVTAASYASFIEALRRLGSIGTERPQARPRWRRRMLTSLAMGPVFSLISSVLPLLPVSLLAWLCDVAPRRFLTHRHSKHAIYFVDANLRSAGYENAPAAWRRKVATAVANSTTSTYFLLYLGFILPPAKLASLLNRLIWPEQFAAYAHQIRAAGGGIVAMLHNDMCVALPMYLALHGHPISWIAGMKSAAIPLVATETFFHAFPAWLEDLIDSTALDARAQSLQRLRAGRVLVILFDAPKQRDTPEEEQPTTQFLGRTVRCYYGPGWLATHANLPVFFAPTYRDGPRTTLQEPQALRPNEALSQRGQVAALTREMYARGERFIRAHPEAWNGWCYLDAFDMRLAEQSQANEAIQVRASTPGVGRPLASASGL